MSVYVFENDFFSQICMLNTTCMHEIALRSLTRAHRHVHSCVHDCTRVHICIQMWAERKASPAAKSSAVPKVHRHQNHLRYYHHHDHHQQQSIISGSIIIITIITSYTRLFVLTSLSFCLFLFCAAVLFALTSLFSSALIRWYRNRAASACL